MAPEFYLFLDPLPSEGMHNNIFALKKRRLIPLKNDEIWLGTKTKIKYFCCIFLRYDVSHAINGSGVEPRMIEPMEVASGIDPKRTINSEHFLRQFLNF